MKYHPVTQEVLNLVAHELDRAVHSILLDDLRHGK